MIPTVPMEVFAIRLSKWDNRKLGLMLTVFHCAIFHLTAPSIVLRLDTPVANALMASTEITVNMVNKIPVV